MTPQSALMVVAPVAAGREAALRELLASMNGDQPGCADPANTVVPFGRFETLHFARLVLIDDALMADLTVYGLSWPRLPTCLMLLVDCDGSAAACRARLVRDAGDGLRRLFGHCADFDPAADLLAWLLAHERPIAANYVNRVGLTVMRKRENQALRRFLAERVPRDAASALTDPQGLRQELVDRVDKACAAGELVLTDDAATPTDWALANALNAVGWPLLALVLLPLILVALPFLLLILRRHEKFDPEYCPPLDPKALAQLQDLEDHGLTNQFTAVGPVKPGLFRRGLMTVILIAIDWACRHVSNRGHLGRVQTIHFGRWVVLDGGTRVFFATNYDGQHEAYMDDFINKVGWGLNLIFSNGVGWPKTDWLLLRGARREQAFKRYQRRHQVPSQVWYQACPGLTLADIERDVAIRAGLSLNHPTREQARAWLRRL
jgi:hypothetical protein